MDFSSDANILWAGEISSGNLIFLKDNNEIEIALATYVMSEGIAGGQLGVVLVNETFFAVGGMDGFIFIFFILKKECASI